MMQFFLDKPGTTGTLVVTIGSRVAAHALVRTASGKRILVQGTHLIPGPCHQFPFTFTESPDGTLMMANGMGPMYRWDGRALALVAAGIDAPTAAPVMTPTLERFSVPSETFTGKQGGQTGVVVRREDIYEEFNRQNTSSFTLTGSIGANEVLFQSTAWIAANYNLYQEWLVGSAIGGPYGCFVRWVDAQNNVSDLSPLSAVIPSVLRPRTTAEADFAQIVRLNRAYQKGLSRDVTGTDQQVFDGGPLPFAFTGAEVRGSAIVYSAIPVPTDANMVRRQILRNTSGQYDTFFVDIDTTDLASTSLSSTLTDSELAAQEAVPLFDEYGFDLANLHGKPPTHKPFICCHQDRMYAAGYRDYSLGSAQVTGGSTLVTGIGTRWTQFLAGRFFYANGAKGLEILSVDDSAQTLTLLAPWASTTDLFASYTIRPAPAELRLLYFSEPGLPTSWPVFNGIGIEEDGDRITGLFSQSSFLYITGERHVYRFTVKLSPLIDGGIFLAANRGSINQQCVVDLGDKTLLIDRRGIWALGGEEEVQSLSDPIQDIFRKDGNGLRINWRTRDAFFGIHDEQARVARWFLCCGSDCRPRHALAYEYLQQRWWVEEYTEAVTAGTLGYPDGDAMLLVGGEADRTLSLTDQPLDLAVPGTATLRGTVTGSGVMTLTDAAATFTNVPVGTPVTLVTGDGRGQTRRIISVTATQLTLDRPWLVWPATSGANVTTYQVGAINWRWRSGWLKLAEVEQANPRGIRLWWQQVVTAQTLDVKLYRDRSEIALLAASSKPVDNVTYTRNVAEATVALEGDRSYAFLHLDRGQERWITSPKTIAIEISGAGGAERISLREVVIEGAMATGANS